jgi:DNA-binding response OmpR family regulator
MSTLDVDRWSNSEALSDESESVCFNDSLFDVNAAGKPARPIFRPMGTTDIRWFQKMRVAALDGDADALELIRMTVRAMGHECHVFTEASAFLRELRRESFDLLVVDWHLRDASGPDVMRAVCQHRQRRTPVLFVTNEYCESDIVEALAAGADSYMTKPVRVGELAARVSALLRRAYAEPPSDEQRWGRYRFVLSARQLEVDGRPLVLTQKEFDLALTLFRNMGRVLSRQHLLEAIWGSNNCMETALMSRTLDTHISRVRTLLGLRAESGYRLSAIYGQGYRLDAEKASQIRIDRADASPIEVSAGEEAAKPWASKNRLAVRIAEPAHLS